MSRSRRHSDSSLSNGLITFLGGLLLLWVFLAWSKRTLDKASTPPGAVVTKTASGAEVKKIGSVTITKQDGKVSVDSGVRSITKTADGKWVKKERN